MRLTSSSSSFGGILDACSEDVTDDAIVVGRSIPIRFAKAWSRALTSISVFACCPMAGGTML
eukprot:CAMPEP_0185759358 /NCGR_PEP_ID=MMETSP1174-20130828/18110_1 /TAXON_ID=35687 /ORGANISM="Dictyocha speculum, Strain CCMP1381" /LENGTH=61 /DNA_ID=CAMNT_0028439663 /DNA_START=67 /DNA_END=249 /DNA_ORIENTATION=+